MTDPPDVGILAERIHLAAIHLLRRLKKEEAGLGLSPAQLSVLTTLVARGSLSIGELARIERVKPPTMTRIVQRLEVAGMVVRKPSGEDARRVRVAHASLAMAVLEEGRALRVDAFGAQLAALPRTDLDVLSRAAELLEELSRGEGPEDGGADLNSR